jgi:DNA-binding LacI/PurR family transcriptional regulator
MSRPSIQDVAKLAQVSPMMVSRVLQGKKGQVSQKNADRILDAVRELDYVPVRSSMQNRHVKTHVIGVAMDDALSFEGLVGATTSHGIREAAFAADYDVLLMRSHRESSLQEQKMQFLDHRCDGFIAISILVNSQQREELLQNLVQHKFPVVSCYYKDVPAGVAWVVPDDTSAMRQAVHRLVRAGHRKIAHLAGPEVFSASSLRYTSFVTAMEEIGLQPYCQRIHTVWRGEVSQAAARQNAARQAEIGQALADLIQQGMTGVVCFNDGMAMSIWKIAQEQGLQIPRDLSIIGVDDAPGAAELGLTTFVNPFREIGRTAVKSLIALLQGGDVEAYYRTLPMEMVDRNSVGPPRLSGSM